MSVLRDFGRHTAFPSAIDACEPFSLTNGASVRMTGTIVASPGAGQAQELQVDSLEILGECNPDVSLGCRPLDPVRSHPSLGIPDPEASPHVRVPPRPRPPASPDRRECGRASSPQRARQISACLLRGTFHTRAMTLCSPHPAAHQKLYRDTTFATHIPPFSLPAIAKAQGRPSV